MKTGRTGRGFQIITHETYPSGDDDRLVQQSSIVGDYDDAFERPGTSALWIGSDFHLSREEVQALVSHLVAWLETGALFSGGDA